MKIKFSLTLLSVKLYSFFSFSLDSFVWMWIKMRQIDIDRPSHTYVCFLWILEAKASAETGPVAMTLGISLGNCPPMTGRGSPLNNNHKRRHSFIDVFCTREFFAIHGPRFYFMDLNVSQQASLMDGWILNKVRPRTVNKDAAFQMCNLVN